MAHTRKWVRFWLRASLVYLSVSCVFGSLFGWGHLDHRPWLLVVKAFCFGGILAGISGEFSKPRPKDTGTEAPPSAV
jgi:hypothetical protein